MDWTIFWTNFLDHVLDHVLDHFIGGGKHTISTEGGVG